METSGEERRLEQVWFLLNGGFFIYSSNRDFLRILDQFAYLQGYAPVRIEA